MASLNWGLMAALAMAAPALSLPAATPAMAQETIILHGASQFGDDHSYDKALLEFQRVVAENYDGPIEFVLHRNMELGTEKEYFAFMSQGVSVDYAIVSPSHMASFSPSAPIMDMPFLYRDLDHWEAVLDGDALKAIETDISNTADVMILGYVGGAVRNVFGRRPVRNLDELQGFTMRVQDAPVLSQIWSAVGAAPTVISGSEVYNAIQTGVIEGAENEAPSIEQLKWYEVGPEISLTQHAITVRPLVFSGTTFRRLPEDLQQAILVAGPEAARVGREAELAADKAVLDRMVQEGLVNVHEFEGRDRLQELAEPVIDEFAAEIGAQDVLQAVRAVDKRS